LERETCPVLLLTLSERKGRTPEEGQRRVPRRRAGAKKSGEQRVEEIVLPTKKGSLPSYLFEIAKRKKRRKALSNDGQESLYCGGERKGGGNTLPEKKTTVSSLIPYISRKKGQRRDVSLQIRGGGGGGGGGGGWGERVPLLQPIRKRNSEGEKEQKHMVELEFPEGKKGNVRCLISPRREKGASFSTCWGQKRGEAHAATEKRKTLIGLEWGKKKRSGWQSG